jgi:uncharacterized protein
MTIPGMIEIRRGLTGTERRFVAQAELRAAGEADAPVFEGHAVVYDQWTTIRDWWIGEFEERIVPGAAAVTIREDDIAFLVNHDASLLLARSRAGEGTLELGEDAVGVTARASLDPRLSYARDVAIALERGDLNGMSFGFTVEEDEWEILPGPNGGERYRRSITRLRMFDVSVVTFPAYEGADAGLRGLALPTRDDVRQLVQLRAGRRNSSADEAVIRSAVEECRAVADELESLLETRSDDDQEAERARARMAEQARAHRANLAKYHRLTPA